MPILLLSILILVSAAIHIHAEYAGPRERVYVFKPLTTGLIIALAVIAKPGPTPPYKALIITGLLFSLAGDVLLMLPADRFVAGLVSFLVAHLFYIGAFVTDAGVAEVWWLAPFGLFAALVYRSLSPNLGRMKGPVIIYILVIVAMAWQAAGRWSTIHNTAAVFAATGAALFVLSDSLLALNRFGHPFRTAQALTLSTYFSAQWLIAISISG